LRSYAKVLGISQDTVVNLYTKLVPPETPDLKPHVAPSRSSSRRAWLVLLGLALGIAIYGMWHFYPSAQVGQGESRESDKKDHVMAAQSAPSDKPVSAVPSQPAVESPAPVHAVEEPLKPEPSVVQSASQETPSSPPQGEPPARDQADDGEGRLSLTGIVKERTWVRITIDGKEEKEYIFQPGSRPQWKGRESFYVLIGNAAGIDFELNGKRVGNLGGPGQVIRLTLPKDVEQRERAN
jgi:cytoskeletal protein RodZ